MSLSSEHLADLKKSGLTEATINEAGIYTVCPGDIKKKLGFDSPQVESLLAIPYGNGFERYKVFPSFKDKDNHAVKYLQPKGTPARLYIPPQAHKGLGNTNTPLAIVEGEKKTLRLIQEGYPAIGIGGIWSWSQKGQAAPDLEKINWQERIVHFFPDSDVWQRPDLLKAVYAFSKELEKRGANVIIYKLPQQGEGKTGIDDYLQQGHAVQELFALPKTTIAGAEFGGLESWLVGREVKKSNEPLTQLESVFKTYFNLEDFTPVKVVLATVLANQAEGDPVWLLLVGVPSSLKSEFIQSLQGLECVYPVSLLTPRTFASGDKTSKDSSLLEQLEDRTIITMKDFGSVLQMRRDDRSEVLASLREIYDGSYTKNFGNGRRVSWEGKLGIIAGCTGIIDEYHSVHQILGERFLLYRLEPCNRAFTGESALKNAGLERGIRQNIKEAVKAFFQTVKPISDWTLGSEYTKKLIALADFVTRARTGVLRDSYNREVTYIPEWEGVPRFAKQLHRLAFGLSCLTNELTLGEENYKILYSVAENSIPKIRRDILSFLLENDGVGIAEDIIERVELPKNAVYRTLEDLQMLRILEHHKPFYRIKEDTKQLLTIATP